MVSTANQHAIEAGVCHTSSRLVDQKVHQHARYRTSEIQAGAHPITAADPYPTTCVTPSMPSPEPVEVRTNLRQVGSH
jgi:hypothetical protein